MRFSEFLCRQPERQTTRIPNFESILEKHYLYTPITGVILMNNSIDYSFDNRSSRQFVFYRNIISLISCSNRQVNLRQYKICRLVNKLKNISLIYLIRWDWFAHIGTVKMGTFHFGGNKKTLWIFTKQQNRRIRWLLIFQ